MIKIKSVISRLIIIALLFSLVSCGKPYNDKDVLCDYDELNCLYYVKDEYKKYKYSDYIFDDVSNGMYKKSTPNIADYRTGNGILDYNIEGYVKAKMDYAIKMDLIDKYEMEVVTNLSYDDEVPVIMFDITTKDTEVEQESIAGRRMMLSDIIAANSTIDGYMKVILGTGKERLKFFMDQRIDNDELYKGIASISTTTRACRPPRTSRTSWTTWR